MNAKTVNTIKIWAIVVGVLSLSNLLTLNVYPIGSTAGLVAVVAIVLGLAVAYAGIQVSTLNLKTVSTIFWVKLAWLVLALLYSISAGGANFVRLLIIVVEGAIVWYLLQSLKKLHQPAPQAG